MIRDAKTADADAICAIARQGFPHDLLRYTIVGAQGYSSYVADRVRLSSGEPTRFRVFEDVGKVLGYAEWRLGRDRIHLNNMFVDQSHRGRGIGDSLMRDMAAIAADQQDRVSAHVFADNERALGWYTKIGFSSGGTRYWTLLEGGDAGELHGLEAPSATPISPEWQLARYGFDELSVRLGDKEIRVGRLGDMLLRYVEADESDTVIAALRSAFSDLQLLVISSRPGLGVLLAEQCELSGSVASVVSRSRHGRSA